MVAELERTGIQVDIGYGSFLGSGQGVEFSGGN